MSCQMVEVDSSEGILMSSLGVLREVNRWAGLFKIPIFRLVPNCNFLRARHAEIFIIFLSVQLEQYVDFWAQIVLCRRCIHR